MTKICKECGRELPLESFNEHRLSGDGRMAICKDCRAKKKLNNGVKLVVKPFEGGNPALARFHPRELIAELKARGYKGRLTIEREVVL